MPEPTKVDQLVNQFQEINRRYESSAKEEKTLGQRVSHLTNEEMAEYVKRTSRYDAGWFDEISAALASLRAGGAN